MHSGFSIYNTLCLLYMLIIHNAMSTLIHLSLMPLGCNLNICLGGSDSLEFVCSGSEAWIEVEPSTEDQAFLSEQAD